MQNQETALNLYAKNMKILDIAPFTIEHHIYSPCLILPNKAPN